MRPLLTTSPLPSAIDRNPCQKLVGRGCGDIRGFLAVAALREYSREQRDKLVVLAGAFMQRNPSAIRKPSYSDGYDRSAPGQKKRASVVCERQIGDAAQASDFLRS